jgi:hypothetical protein
MLMSCSAPIGDLNRSASRLVRADSAAEFDGVKWRSGDRALRGRMLADFAGRHALVGRHNREVVALLGPIECYADYEDVPCYFVQLDGRPFMLEFGVNHSDHPGMVIYARLEEQRVRPR